MKHRKQKNHVLLKELGINIVWLFLLVMFPTGANAQRREVFGRSVEGRPLVASVFGDGPNVTVILGGFHNNEPASAAVVRTLERYLQTHPEEWRGSTIVVVPLVNPDSQSSGNRTNANGVDLNRNFPGSWRVVSTAAKYNPGPAAGSEPETRAVIHLVEKYEPSKIVSVHQPFHVLNWNGERGRALAEEMSAYNGYETSSDIGYPTPGSFGSYVEGLGIAMVTLELPVVDAAACWSQNRNALLAAIRLLSDQ